MQFIALLLVLNVAYNIISVAYVAKFYFYTKNVQMQIRLPVVLVLLESPLILGVPFILGKVENKMGLQNDKLEF